MKNCDGVQYVKHPIKYSSFYWAITANHGIEQAHINSARLAETGLWGVPSFIVDNEAFWGQERLDMFDEYNLNRR